MNSTLKSVLLNIENEIRNLKQTKNDINIENACINEQLSKRIDSLERILYDLKALKDLEKEKNNE